MINHDGMVNDEINLAEWINLVWFSPKVDDRVSHGSEINNEWDSSEILENNSSWFKGNFDIILIVLLPVKNLLNIGRFNIKLITVSQGTLQQYSDRKW